MSTTTTDPHKVWGRVLAHGEWRPAYTADADRKMFVAPAVDLGWRHATAEERATWQKRIPAEQRTTGRVWDDALYEAVQ